MPKRKTKRKYTSSKRITKVEYYHEPKEVSKAQLNTYKSLFFNLSMDREKNILGKTVIPKKPNIKGIEPTSISQEICNLHGAFPYLFEKTAIFCTHDSEYIDLSDPDYGRITVTWEYFCQGIKRKEKMQKELSRLFGLSTTSRVSTGEQSDPTYKLIDVGDHFVFTQPFVITLHTKDKNTLTKIDNIARTPIDTITIRFFKPLFENYLKYKNNYHNVPVGWYDIIQDFIEDHNLHTNPVGVLKTWAYLNYHDNSIGRHKLINIYDMLLHVDPQAIRIRENHVELRDDKARAFMFDTIALLQQITQNYKHILNFTLDGFTVPDIPGIEQFDKLPNPVKIQIILKALKQNQGKIVLSITRNPKAIPQPELFSNL
jgi:hypothetical protein